MGLNVKIKKTAPLFALLMAICVFANAADESYIQTLSGKIKKGDSCSVVDDKFLNLPLAEWNKIRNISVDNIISFDLRNDSDFYYYNKAFTCTLKISIKYFTSHDQQNPVVIDTVSLMVKYDTATGKYYPVSSSYKFKNAFKVTVIVDSLFSPEWGNELPPIFRIRNQIMVSRKYPFSREISAANMRIGVPDEEGRQTNRVLPDQTPGKIIIDWGTSFTGTGAEEIDVEWTYIDVLSARGTQINDYAAGGGNFNVPLSKMEEWMRFNSTRVTISPNSSYTITQHYPEGYIIARLRTASVSDVNGQSLRETSNWLYADNNSIILCAYIDAQKAHETNLNWQYNGSFAEEGKNKEVMSYFDATLRSRQTVTINNSDDKAVAAETIYDNMGRPTLAILPAPINDNKLKYYTSLNLNLSGQPYSHTDITQGGSNGNCYPIAANLDDVNSIGAARYYSPDNAFLGNNDFYFTKYVPDAKKKPFSLTQYMADNTGRIRSQGGVGEVFQPGSNRETRYYYGKPLQSELDRLFGMEAGYTSHYLKNMVVDANGQVSVSYIDAAGKTIATALAGVAPGNLDPLPSALAEESKKIRNQILMRPSDFIKNAGTLTKKAVATFLAPVANAQYKVNYVVNPSSLGPYNGLLEGEQFCTNCFYNVIVFVKNDCGDVVASKTSTAFSGTDISCGTATPVNDVLEFIAPKIGEYTVTYSLQLSRDIINEQVEYYIANNRDLKTLQDFFHDEMLAANLKGCYSDCNTCQEKLGTEEQFTNKMHELLEQLKQEKYSGYTFNTNSPEIQEWIHTTYLDLVANCNSLAPNCVPISPCEKNLEMMKNDVRPSGQYAMVDYDEPNDAYTFNNDPTNLLPLYNTPPPSPGHPDYQILSDIYNISFIGDNGNTVLARSLSVSDFIKAYLQHPEWADKFVKKHIEYCSYLWCKDQYGESSPPAAFNNEASYTFDERLREQATTGQKAIDMGYFDPFSLNGYTKILDLNNPYCDPFFKSPGRGYNYRTSMLADLANLSNVLGMTPRDASGNLQPVKNILQLTDWLLYCMPTQANPTVADYLNSWNNCNPSAGCRSLTQEWELYRGYYLQIKSKYMAVIKQNVIPECSNCFVGTDGLSGNTGLGNCSGAGNASCPVFSDFHYEAPQLYDNTFTVGTETFRDDSWDNYFVHNNGPVTMPITFVVNERHTNIDPEPYGDCSTHYYWTYLPPRLVTIYPGQDRVFLGNTTTYMIYNSTPSCYYYYNGTVINQHLYDVEPLSISCPPPLPESSCPADPNYQFYKDKIRIWNDYINMQGYTNCLGGGVNPTNGAALQRIVEEAIANVNAMAEFRVDDQTNDGTWASRLRSVVAEENEQDPGNGINPPRFLSLVDDVTVNGVSIANSTIRTLITALKDIAIRNINYQASLPDPNPFMIRGASVLPTAVPGPGFNNFTDAFNSIIGPALVAKGFGPHLLDQPYPYNKNAITLNGATDMLSGDICTRVDAMYQRYQTVTGNSTISGFQTFLTNELGDDYLLTLPQLQQIMDRCATNCRFLGEPLVLPVVFSSPNPGNPDHPWVNCQRIAALHSQFSQLYADVAPGTKLYEVLYENYLNHQLGYALSYYEYKDFETACINSPDKVLYNKPASPIIAIDDFLCVKNVMAGVFERAGQEYIAYIERERIRFRNELIAKCLNNSASAKLEGEQYEYHYTLYYYDQSGNLVKTIPPEGVAFLSESELELVEDFRDDDAVCTGVGVPNSENATATFNALSSALQNTSTVTHAAEMWLYSASGTTRQVRIITSDHKYFYQVAIKDNKLWAELYTLQRSGASNQEINITLSNQVVADLSALPPLQPWTHVFIQSTGSLTGGTLQLYLDGRKLTNITSSAPGYPFEWEMNSTTGSYTLPAQNLAVLKHFRTYNAIAADAQVWANYKNSCLSPVGQLDVNGNNAYAIWGRFNIPAPGTVTTTGPGSTTEIINRFIVPDHGLPTNYAYNSLNQVIKQNSPDGGTSEFWYDRLGRLAVSQNAEQKQPTEVNAENPANRYSYTRFDPLGRIIEVGEKINATSSMTEDKARNETDLSIWLSAIANGSKRQITISAYDEAPVWAPGALAGQQHNLRKRVSATALISASPNSGFGALIALVGSRVSASYYSYDLIGNVNTLVQENKDLAAAEAAHITGSTGLKQIKYEYDLVSGKVNRVLYQDGKWDQFYYHYLYDAENRLVSAWSSRTKTGSPSDVNTEWVKEATYRYYLHGPLARMELGRNKVQGVDYAYTLQGWLKGVNSQFLDPDKDMSGDGKHAGVGNFGDFGRDVFGFSLGYYMNDYSPIGGSGAPAFGLNYLPSVNCAGCPPDLETGRQLFNGNIGHATYAIKQLENGNTIGYTYRYDQLNRITGMRRNNITAGAATWSNTGIIEAYKEEISYDANGNTKTYLRNGNLPAGSYGMDNMNYNYNVDNNGRLVNNKLRHVDDDAALAGLYTEDIDDQNADNYQYDNIGNLVKDVAEKIETIDWTVYGKISHIFKNDVTVSEFGAIGSTTDIKYKYDPSGNRISKSVVRTVFSEAAPPPPQEKNSYYVRDAQGNVLAVYENVPGNEMQAASYSWVEQHLYGSSRLGIVSPNFMIGGIIGEPTTLPNDSYNPTNDPVTNGIAGMRTYELSNHLGNVLVTINDIKTGVDDDGNPGVDYYKATVITANDYYPFGMMMPGRKYSIGNGYRYGFNGQEHDKDINENITTALYWEYDSRIGRRWNPDPVLKSMISPYACLGNNPIIYIDPLGNDWYKNKKTNDYEFFEGNKRHKGYKHMTTGTWSGRDSKGFSYYFGEGADGLLSAGPSSEGENVTVTSTKPGKPRKWGSYRWFDGSYHTINRDFQTNLATYSRVKDGQMTLAEALKNPSFAEDFGSSEKNKFENHYKAEKEWRAWQYGAVALFTAPFAIEFIATAAPSVAGSVASLELPALYTETSLYAWRATTVALNWSKSKLVLGAFSLAHRYIPFSWKREMVKQLNTSLPNLVTPVNIEIIAELFVPGPGAKK